MREKGEKSNYEYKARIIAAAVTFALLLLMALACLFVKFSLSADDDLRKATPQLMAADMEDEYMDEEDFIEPPKEVEDAGEPSPSEIQDDTPAPSPLGEPDRSTVKSDKVSTSGNRTKPNKSAEKLVTQKHESSLKHTNPSKKNEPDSRISSEMGNKFNAHNGKPTGKEVGTAGSSDTGSGAGSAVGTLDGKRKMLSCNNRFPVRLSRKITVIVKVTVNDKGRVIKARCITPGVDRNLASKLEKESLGSTWTPKAGAANADGRITWTLKPSVR